MSKLNELSDASISSINTNRMSNSSIYQPESSRKHNYDLEKHKIKQEPKKHVFSRQESFLKKFSTRRNATATNTTTFITLIKEQSSTTETIPSNHKFILENEDKTDKTDSNIVNNSHFSINQATRSSLTRMPLDKNRFSHSISNSPIIDFKFSPNKSKKNLDEDSPSKVITQDESITKLSVDANKKRASTKNRKSLIPCVSGEPTIINSLDKSNANKNTRLHICWDTFLSKFNYFVFGPDSDCTFFWLTILNLCFLYNIWLIIARQSFEKLQVMFAYYWRIADSVSDFIYLIDILVHFRTGYLEQGLLVYDSKKLAINYLKSNKFLLDIFSLAPFELFELYFGYSIPMLRFSRFLKFYRLMELFYIVESRTLYPNVWRVLLLTSILLLLGHWFAGFYFLISKAEGFKGHWSYPEPVDEFALLPRMYLRCLYWSTLTLTTIGDLPPPETNWQWLREMSNMRYLFSIAVHYLAVFVIALIVGQVGNVITNRNANRVEFERLLDGAKQYMRNHNVPNEMQKRVQRWYDYSWSRGRMNGSGDIHSIGLLPDKLKTELALHVNLETLRKVTIFQECQPEFLHDLVLKMRAYIFTPGDMICRKGEVAREMFIIADGVLEVIGNNNNVLTKMYSGDFFGEIGILNIEGASNKRTADVRSVGYAELFSLSKEDILSAVKDYPEAERILIEYGKRRLNQNISKKSSIHPDVVEEDSATLSENTLAQKNDEVLKESSFINKRVEHHLLSTSLKRIDSDTELDAVFEENRGFATDMLKLPKYSTLTIKSSSSENISRKSDSKDEIIFRKLPNKFVTKKFILDSLDEILEICILSDNYESRNQELITTKILELKDKLVSSQDNQAILKEDIICQKDAKIKLLNSRIKILQKYLTQKNTAVNSF